MKEVDQAENDLEAKGVDTKLFLNNGLWNSMLPSDDVSEKQGLDSLRLGPICLYQTWLPNLGALEDRGLDNRLHEMEFG